MKTLLIPTLAVALSCLTARAQEIAAPKTTPPTESSTAKKSDEAPRTEKAPNRAEEADKALRAKMNSQAVIVLRNPVQFPEMNLNDVAQLLNDMLEAQGAEPLNLVVSPEVDNVKVPAMTLHNVSAIDALKVVTKVAGLSLESVPSDSGKVAAWIIGPPKKTAGMAGMSLGMMGGGMGGGFGAGGGESGADQTVEARGGATTPAPATTPGEASARIAGMPGTANNFFGAFAKGGGAGSVGAGGGGSATWVDPASGVPPPAQINRVLGIARIYGDIPNEQERAKQEDMLVRLLEDMTGMQKMKCDVRLYGELHLLVVKGSPEAVELVEQAVAALKENAGAKKSESGGSKFNSGIGIKQ